jgi:hypothetical protein
VIRFDEESKHYTLRDLGEGSGTFVKIETPYVLSGTRIISFGDTHMVVKVLRDSIEIKFVDGPKQDEEFKFSVEQTPVTIGRQ